MLWMTAACVDSAIATSLGVVYSAARMFYSLSYAYYGGFSMPVELITQPNYVVLHTYAAALLCFGLGGGSIFSLLGQYFLLWFPATFVLNLLGLFMVWNYPV